MTSKKEVNDKVDIDFESHPPIEQDTDGIANLLRQTLLNFCDCSSLAKYLVHLKDVTQIIAQAAPDEENVDDDDELDDDIYGVSSVINLTPSDPKEPFADVRQQLTKFLKEKCPQVKELLDSDDKQNKIGLVINERYINLPPQLALPTLRTLTEHLDGASFSHLVFISKIHIRSKNSDQKIPNKKVKSEGGASTNVSEPIIYANAEEEIICENSRHQSEFDVSSLCDENAIWSLSSDVKYIPHRKILLVDYKKWDTIMKNLNEELKL